MALSIDAISTYTLLAPVKIIIVSEEGLSDGTLKNWAWFVLIVVLIIACGILWLCGKSFSEHNFEHQADFFQLPSTLSTQYYLTRVQMTVMKEVKMEAETEVEVEDIYMMSEAELSGSASGAH